MYFCSHRSLWKPLLNKLLPTASLGLGVTALMFAFTYVPQAAVLAVFNGPLAIFTTILLVRKSDLGLLCPVARRVLPPPEGAE